MAVVLIVCRRDLPTSSCIVVDRCFLTAEMILPLIECKSLKKLNLSDKSSTKERSIYLSSLLRGIGPQLRSLTIQSRISHELTSQIPELCPYLEVLWVRLPKGCVPGRVVLEKRFRKEMKRLGAVSLQEVGLGISWFIK